MSSDSDSDGELGEAFCEVCGSNQQRMVMVLCACYSPTHLVGCHTYCMAGHRWRQAGIDTDYYCHFCAEFRKHAHRAVEDFRDQRRRQALQRRGKTETEGEEMPALPQLGSSRGVLLHAAVEPVPTVQMRMDAAAKAAAAGAAGQVRAQPAAAGADREAAVVRKLIRQQAAPGAGGKGGGASATGRKLGSVPAAGGQPVKRPGKPTGNFVTGLNKNKPAVVTAAAAKARQQAVQGRHAAAAAAVVPPIEPSQPQQQQQQHLLRHPVDVPEYRVALVQAHISCQVVQAGTQPTGDALENPPINLHGRLKRSTEIQKWATAEQIKFFDDILLPELIDTGTEERKYLTGGVFDLGMHPTVTRYNTDEELAYRPILFEPAQRMRDTVKEQLLQRNHFLVVSLDRRLLVFLPTDDGCLQLLLPKHAEAMDDLVQEVVKSVMRDKVIEVRQQQQQQQGVRFDEAEESASAELEDQDLGVLQQVEEHMLDDAAAQQQQQTLQQTNAAEQQLLHQQLCHELLGMDVEEPVCPDPSAPAAPDAAALKPVQQLPQGMTQHYKQQEVQQQQQHQVVEQRYQAQQQQQQPPSSVATATATTAAAAAAASHGRAGGHGSRAAVHEVVQASSLAQLLRMRAGSTGNNVLSAKHIMPQIQDMAPVHKLRIYMVGFGPDQLQPSTPLVGMITAAVNLGVTVNCEPDALQQLCRDLNISATTAAAGSSAGSPFDSPPRSPNSGQTTAAAAAAAMAASAGAGYTEDDMMVDAADDDESPAGLSRHILLLPQHTTAAGLQELLAGFPLWRLLTAPVCIMFQGGGQGLLQYLFWLEQQQRQQSQPSDLRSQSMEQSVGSQQQQQQQSSGGMRGGQVHGGTPLQSQPEEGEIVDPNHQRSTATHLSQQRNVNQGVSVVHQGAQLPLDLQYCQWFRRGVAVVVDSAALKSSSKQQIRCLLLLLQQRQELQQQWWQQQQASALSIMPFNWQLVISKDDLDSLSDDTDRWQLLKPEVGIGRVQILDEVLTPGTMAEESDSPPALMANALSLAAQQQHTLRLVILTVPNIDQDVRQQQLTPLGSSGTLGGSTPSPRRQTPSHDLGYGANALAATAAAMAATGDRDVEEQQHMDPVYRREGKRNLESASKEGRILAGTVNQVLLLLEEIAVGSSADAGGAAGQAAPMSP